MAIKVIGRSLLIPLEWRFWLVMRFVLHTIILPLIDESDYNWWKKIAGDTPKVLISLKIQPFLPSVQLISGFDLENVLYAIYQEDPDEFGRIRNIQNAEMIITIVETRAYYGKL